MSFSLHPQLLRDCITLGESKLCEILLLNDQQFPWLILVPKIESICEIFQLDEQDQLSLATETNHIGQLMMEHFKGDKLNIGALGNLVPQLHVHVIVRFKEDPAWPKPVWGNYSAQTYSTQDLNATCSELRALLKDVLLA